MELQGDCLVNRPAQAVQPGETEVESAGPARIDQFLASLRTVLTQDKRVNRLRMRTLPGNSNDYHLVDPDALLIANRATNLNPEESTGIEAPGFCILRVRLEGTLDEDLGEQSHLWEGANSSFLCLSEGLRYRFKTIRRAPMLSVSLVFRLPWLHKVVGDKAQGAVSKLEQALSAEDSAAHILHVNVEPPLIHVTRRLLEHFDQPTIEPLLVQMLTQEMLAHALIGLDTQEERQESGILLREADMQQLEAVKARLDERVTERPSLEELSHLAGMNRNKLNNGFRMLYGSSVGEYGRLRCLELARQLLSRGERVGEVADRVGYQDQGSFTKAFKQAYGVTPSAYRSNP